MRAMNAAVPSSPGSGRLKLIEKLCHGVVYPFSASIRRQGRIHRPFRPPAPDPLAINAGYDVNYE